MRDPPPRCLACGLEMKEIYTHANVRDERPIPVPQCRTQTFNWDSERQLYEYVFGITTDGHFERERIVCPCHEHPVEGATYEHGTIRISDEARMEGLL
jgi:hypothetical protein